MVENGGVIPWERMRDAQTGLQEWISNFTGYNRVENLKEQESLHHSEFRMAKDRMRTLTEEYERAVQKRSTTQSQVNSLLNRRLEWTSEEAQRFAQINTQDIVLKATEAEARNALDQGMEAVDLCQGKWLRAVEQHRKQELAYIENSRHLGTYASLALLSLNTIMFAANFLVLEPWKLRRIKSVVEANRDEILQQIPTSDAESHHMHQVSGKISEMREQLQAIQERHVVSEQKVDEKLNHAVSKISAALADIQNLSNSEDTSHVSVHDSLIHNSRRDLWIETRQQLFTLSSVACVAGIVSGTMCVVVLGLLKSK
eukprot:CAMPEP_0114241664 /NCGR_PEP_ID=MMETSP0058-20121206/9749_1 /TAXON_ID=36894 /ORGANISM="Pyramimonas parkeae, CCMP726" /LENGTH=313 /DNA_ID=CAMNT_0001354197 /DNA_START=67 /DNA_END=1009 /DNA_ORIENTATION=-